MKKPKPLDPAVAKAEVEELSEDIFTEPLKLMESL